MGLCADEPVCRRGCWQCVATWRGVPHHPVSRRMPITHPLVHQQTPRNPVFTNISNNLFSALFFVINFSESEYVNIIMFTFAVISRIRLKLYSSNDSLYVCASTSASMHSIATNGRDHLQHESIAFPASKLKIKHNLSMTRPEMPRYASAARFAPPMVRDTLPSTPFDATNILGFGQDACIQGNYTPGEKSYG